MPVAKHRESWTGSAEVLVVSQLAESEPIVAFDERGRESRSTATSRPSSHALDRTRRDALQRADGSGGSKNVRDNSGTAIGTLERMVPNWIESHRVQ